MARTVKAKVKEVTLTVITLKGETEIELPYSKSDAKLKKMASDIVGDCIIKDKTIREVVWEMPIEEFMKNAKPIYS